MQFDIPSIDEILNLEQLDANIFRGTGVFTGLQRTYGGQVAAQALSAATKTVGEDKLVHSLHGYFIRPGQADKDIVFVVNRVRDGRSFSTRIVDGVQGGETIFSLEASFHITSDKGIEHSDKMRKVPDPEGLVPLEETGGPLKFFSMWANDWDVRIVPDEDFEHNPYTPSQQVVWFKSKRELPDDQTFHICTLAYMSDLTLLHSALVPHRDAKVQMASLDHAMWFLRPFRADEWMLYDQVSPSAHGARALTQGRIFDSAGNLVAMTVQEGLTRTLRENGVAFS
ncbi:MULTISPECIES: acyl-CoA thioesterase II [unclassified Corynebacterium]|uniref:acyl-CoA thioesterase n=1 Tax=unclassified Corynebacterium TaxID=2624378 RepID=UPI00264E5668|nr:MULTISPECIES: acyl-CoA thioesterase II [unclassified Corynebacterium]MDN8593845.1 acyl-CoA thioesterase II [Corynebacterium sp. P4_F2]WKK55951.1 acyl-CoA thioesterase II [Corynebacterium sp. P4-C1]WKK63362.1 acyl-CoA thioesterase II [Corynebacterium sp. P8-C1]